LGCETAAKPAAYPPKPFQGSKRGGDGKKEEEEEELDDP